jgi:hypothetical protein
MDVVYEALKILKLVIQARAPYDTGNMAINSVRIVGNAVYIGGEIADYAPFTNEPWTAEKWHGAKNPNEGWVQAAIQEASPMIQQVLNGKATREDINATQKKYVGIIADRKKRMVENLKQLRDNI